jgi:choline dehydrogenase-like flavoprotein
VAQIEPDTHWDYVVVGSGAGGGTLAARLAEQGMRVFLLEAGSDAHSSGAARMPDDYDVPAFHPFATENPALSWDFFVRHYTDERQQRRDPKCTSQGVLYPRTAALGGCTAHNAMIFVYPHDADWDGIAQLTGDPSWRATNMRRYAKRLERCTYQPLGKIAARLGIDPTAHGWRGWLPTELAIPLDALSDDAVLRVVLLSLEVSTRGKSRHWRALRRRLRWRGDPNGKRRGGAEFDGIGYAPLTTSGHVRSGTRERLLDVARRSPGNLHIELDALATRVILDEHGTAVGVEYLKGSKLYAAHPAPNPAGGTRAEVRARREVILCGGAFNTPQLLMLSGIGPADALRAHGIEVKVDLPGVGRNLQDRYEVGVVNRMARPWKVLEGATFKIDDPHGVEWTQRRAGVYTSNGVATAVVRRSGAAREVPDLFCSAFFTRFSGYFPGYSKLVVSDHAALTWVVLKAHTQNRAGSVTLRSANPRDTPLINFRYFEEGSDTAGDDLRAVVDGIRFARKLAAPLIEQGLIAGEELPGPQVQSDEELATFVRDNAWGHHASCTCAIGERDAGGVLSSAFVVHGTRNLRVVDASAFPRIPGFYIASAVYMIGEKAADVILEHASR